MRRRSHVPTCTAAEMDEATRVEQLSIEVERLKAQVEALRQAVFASSNLGLQAVLLANVSDREAHDRISESMDRWLVTMDRLLNKGAFVEGGVDER